MEGRRERTVRDTCAKHKVDREGQEATNEVRSLEGTWIPYKSSFRENSLQGGNYKEAGNWVEAPGPINIFSRW